jgi:hypothetical protein
MNMLTFNYIGFAINLLGIVSCVAAFVLNIMEGQYITAAVMALLAVANSYFAVETIKRIYALRENE